ncbi:efflux RND transporter periplasmic adaptor subunit [Parasulfuritortus cantonensis]|nr:efflux RND transporter periplasmic adaptor subunit [Parasulfuritortus cantonensis]
MMTRTLILALFAAPAWAADLSGQLDWSQRVVIATPLAGVVETVEVLPGQRIAKDGVLLSLNQTVYKAGLMEANADISRLTEELADARRELDRANELYSRTVSSTTELDAAKLRHARAAALLAAAEARVEKARRLLDESAPRAPFDALVLDRLAEPGMAVAGQCQPTPLLVLARADEIVARAGLPAGQATGLKPGAKATVAVAGKSVAGRIAAVRAKADGRYEVDVAIPRGGLVAGMAASIRLP